MLAHVPPPVAIGGSEPVLVPIVYFAFGTFFVARGWQTFRGNIIPHRFPPWFVNVGYGLGFFIQIVSLVGLLQQALQMKPAACQAFFQSAAMSFSLDIWLNEPVKIVAMANASALMDAFLEGFLFKGVSDILT
eukprot:gene4152-2137_t